MTTPLVVGMVLLLLLGLSLLRVGVAVAYSAAGLRVRLRLGPLRFSLYPWRQKKKRKKTEKRRRAGRNKADQEPPAAEKRGGRTELLFRLIPVACEAAGRFRRRLRIDLLCIDLTLAGGEDAARGAIQFGQASAAMGAMTALLENSFQVRERRLRSRVDFTLTQPEVLLSASLSLTLGQCLSLGLWAGMRVLRTMLALGREKKQAAGAAERKARKE